MKTVLFVCVHNAGRSQMAESFVNHLAKSQTLPIRAISAGTTAGSQINPNAEAVMSEIGLSMDGQRPKNLSQDMADIADRIITMGCGVSADSCPANILISEDWELDDPAGQSIDRVREIRDEIERRVLAMLEEMNDGHD